MHYTANIWQFRQKKMKLIRNQMIVFFQMKLRYLDDFVFRVSDDLSLGFSHVCIARLELSTMNKTTLDFRCCCSCWSWMGACFVSEHLQFFELVDFCFVLFFCVFICQCFFSALLLSSSLCHFFFIFQLRICFLYFWFTMNSIFLFSQKFSLTKMLLFWNWY